MSLNPRQAAWRVGAIHLLLAAMALWHIAHSSDGQSALIWIFFVAIDFPLSLAYLVPPELVRTVLGENVYWPTVIHCVFGSAWWCLLAYLTMRSLERRKERQRVA